MMIMIIIVLIIIWVGPETSVSAAVKIELDPVTQRFPVALDTPCTYSEAN